MKMLFILMTAMVNVCVLFVNINAFMHIDIWQWYVVPLMGMLVLSLMMLGISIQEYKEKK